MAAEHHIHAPSLAFHADQPLIGMVLMEDGHEVVRLFVDEAETLIAATALERGLTLVTTDADHTRVPGLEVMLMERRTLRSVDHA